jgi:hypothetical protein
LVVETARKTKVATHFLPANDGTRIRAIKAWIDDGAIGTLREVHNWSNRPMWPQYPTIPTDKPPIPEGFDWSLWNQENCRPKVGAKDATAFGWSSRTGC